MRRPIHPTEDRQDYRGAELWLEDLEEIVALFLEIDANAEIRTDRYEIDQVSDLRGVDESSIEKLVLTSKDGRSRLFFGSAMAFVAIESPTRDTRAVLGEIERVVEKRKTGVIRFRTFRSYVLTTVSILSALLAFFIVSSDEGSYTQSRVVGLIIAAVAGIALAPLHKFLLRPPGMVMHARSRTEHPPWLERNKDALVTNSIVSAGFLVLGVVLGQLLPDLF
ncbi:hypothetical protein [Jidongwangia harbinensis]|uniref:hypothetical protein n=1 Tax=Jidongwangia harbinensis TaxID=2878561 RepID=UPI001CDA2825|nr:hypothetical protein [Jidongwangia harbinensis]MCA2213825.1 hypothetical protein [Jidongwangia harbinensis]